MGCSASKTTKVSSKTVERTEDVTADFPQKSSASDGRIEDEIQETPVEIFDGSENTPDFKHKGTELGDKPTTAIYDQRNVDSVIDLQKKEEGPQLTSISVTRPLLNKEELKEKAEIDIAKLYEALQMYKVDECVLVDVITKQTAEYRQMLRRLYAEKYKEDLCKLIERKTSGTLQYFLSRLLCTREEYLCTLLHSYTNSCKYPLITEVLTAWQPNVVTTAKEQYAQVYNSTFFADMKSTLDDHVAVSLKNVMLPLSGLLRNVNHGNIDERMVEREMDDMSQSCEDLLNLLVIEEHSCVMVAMLCEKYKAKYYVSVADSIDIEFSDETKTCLTNIVSICEDSVSYFARELFVAVNGNDRRRILDICIGRNEIDLSLVLLEFNSAYSGSTLLNGTKMLFDDMTFRAFEILMESNGIRFA